MVGIYMCDQPALQLSSGIFLNHYIIVYSLTAGIVVIADWCIELVQGCNFYQVE